MRTITTCAGIGDSIWLFMKLINSGERFDFRIPDGSPQRGKQIFDLMPGIANSCNYVPGLSYSKVKEKNIGTGRWSEIKDRSFFLEANSHLEAGKRIEDWLPDLKTTFNLCYATKIKDVSKAQHLLGDKYIYIGIYVSAYRNNNRHWNMWRQDEWVKFMHLIYRECPEVCFIIIGAEYDNDHSAEVMKRIHGKIPYVNTIGQPLSVVIEILKRLSYFIGFPSGLSILNETLGKSGAMFYPKHLSAMMNTWADPGRIKAGDYKAVQLCSPEKLFSWIKNDYELFKKV